MTDDERSQREEPEPPRDASEAELVWRAPAAGCSPSLVIIALGALGFAVGLWVLEFWLLAILLLVVPLVVSPLLVVKSEHLLGPGGVTIRLPFGTQSQRWSDFIGFWAERGKVYLQPEVQPMAVPHSARVILNAPANVEQVAAYVLRYLPELTGDGRGDHG